MRGWYSNSGTLAPSISLLCHPQYILIVQYSCWHTGHHISRPESRVEEELSSLKILPDILTTNFTYIVIWPLLIAKETGKCLEAGKQGS